MPLSSEFRTYLAELLSALGKIRMRRVFGYDGILAGDVLLGFVIDERIYFRTDGESRDAYKSEGSQPFAFTKPSGEHIVTSYYALPDRLYDEPHEIVQWARRARAAALESPSARMRRAKRARRTMKSTAAPEKRRR